MTQNTYPADSQSDDSIEAILRSPHIKHVIYASNRPKMDEIRTKVPHKNLGELETDAAVVSASYRKIVKEIDDELIRRDMTALKFLCCDVIPVAKLERISGGIGLVEQLETKNKAGEGNLLFLAEILYRIGRLDLVKKLGYTPDILKTHLEAMGSGLSPYRLLLHELSEQLTTKDVETAKFMCPRERISRMKIESMKTPQDFLQCLEQVQAITPNKLDLLKEILEFLGRNDLLQKFSMFNPEDGSFKDDTTIYAPGFDEVDIAGPRGHKLEVYEPSLDSLSDTTQRIDSAVQQQYAAYGPQALDYSGLNEPQDRTHYERESKISPDTYKSQWQYEVQEPGYDVEPTQLRLRSTGVQTSVRPEPMPPVSRKERQVTFSRGQGTSQTRMQNVYFAPSDIPEQLYGYFDQTLQLSNHPNSRPNSQAYRDIAYRENPYTKSQSVHYSQAGRAFEPYSRSSSQGNPANLAYQSPEAEEEDDLPCYKMDKHPRGLCLIINNKHFTKDEKDKESQRMPNREGTDIDRQKMEEIFKQLQFEVHIYSDLTDVEITRTLADFAVNKDHSLYNCFVCCILTHGAEGKLYGTNGKLVAIKDLLNFFKGVSSPSLRGKPKIFFIQACQGKEKQPAVPVEEPEEDGPSHGRTVDMETIPNEADFLLGYASLPGFVSYRSKSTGSWYISTLYHMLKRYANRYDLLSILIKVNEEVGRATAHAQHKQSPAPLATLRKKIFFT